MRWHQQVTDGTGATSRGMSAGGHPGHEEFPFCRIHPTDLMMIKWLFTTAAFVVIVAGCPGRQAEGYAPCPHQGATPTTGHLSLLHVWRPRRKRINSAFPPLTQQL